MKRPAKKSATRLTNQRLSTSRQRRQQHLLDVRVRSQRATHHRNRRALVFVAKVVIVLVLGLGIILGVREALNRFFFQNPDYRLSALGVQTDGTLSREQILHAAGISEGLNMFSVNLAQVHDRVQQLPQVDEVQVERKMPNEIDIRITERRPIAWISSEKEIADPFTSDSAFLVDARGILMKEKKLAPEYLSLPSITGCADEALVPGKAVESFEGKSALALLRLTTTSFMQTRFQIRDIDVSKGYCLLVTDKNHSVVMFAFDNLEAQMQRLEQLLVYADDMHRQIATANLLVARNVPVTFAAPVSEIISQVQEEDEDSTKSSPKENRPANKPEIRRAQAAEPIVRHNSAVSPGVKKFHSRPGASATPTPVRKAIPIQHFNQEN